jgi:hypothetical protein
MKTYERIYSLFIEGVDTEAFKDFWSQHEKAGKAGKAKPTRASKKTQAATNRAKKKEAEGATKKFTGGSYLQQRGK